MFESSLMRLDCDRAFAALTGFLADSYSCEVDGSFLVVQTPLIYADGDSIRVYIDLTSLLAHVTVTDLGDGVNRAKSYSLDVSASRLRDALGALEVSVTQGKVLSRRVPIENVGAAIFAVAQGAAIAEAIAVERPVSTKGPFYQEVDRFFVSAHVPYRRDVFYPIILGGRDAERRTVRKKVDFLIADTALLLTVPRNRQTLRHAEHAYTLWSLMAASDDHSPRLTIVDDSLRDDDNVELLENFSAVVTLSQLRETRGDPEAIISMGARSFAETSLGAEIHRVLPPNAHA